MINYNISVELCGERTTYTDIVFTSGDIFAYRLNFSFFENGAPVDVSDCTLLIKAKRKDGVVITDAGTTKDGLAYIDIKNSMIALSGEVSFEIALSDSKGSYITTKELIAYVREGHGDSDISAEDTAPVLSSLLLAAGEIKSTANDAKALASEAKTMAFNTYDRENIDIFLSSKADVGASYTKTETDELLENATKDAKPYIIPIEITEDESGKFRVTQGATVPFTDLSNVVLKTTILPQGDIVYSSSATVSGAKYFWTILYDSEDMVRVLTVAGSGDLGVELLSIWEDKLLSQSDLDVALSSKADVGTVYTTKEVDGKFEQVGNAIEDVKPYIASIELTENESGGFDVSSIPVGLSDVGNAIENGRDVILKVKITRLAGGTVTVYSSSMTYFGGYYYWTVFYNLASMFRILKIRAEIGGTGEIQVFEEDIVSQADLDEAIGDVETSLENIITKYGLGGEKA